MSKDSASVRSEWTFDGAWPYAPNYFDTGVGRMHYVDEGPRDGRPVVLVHGNPTWGYLYRNFISPLSESGCRVVVPDHLGFGRSRKPVTFCKKTRPSSSSRICSSS